MIEHAVEITFYLFLATASIGGAICIFILYKYYTYIKNNTSSSIETYAKDKLLAASISDMSIYLQGRKNGNTYNMLIIVNNGDNTPKPEIILNKLIDKELVYTVDVDNHNPIRSLNEN